MFVCEVCQKEYKSRSGLRRHVKSKHPSTGLRTGRVAVPMVEKAVSPEDFGLVEVSAEVIEGLAAAGSQEDMDALLVACKELEVEPKDVMAFKVYHDHVPLKVVLIEGPVGHKRVWLAE